MMNSRILKLDDIYFSLEHLKLKTKQIKSLKNIYSSKGNYKTAIEIPEL